MVSNDECLQLIENNEVQCRRNTRFGYAQDTLQCPLATCEARIVLEDQRLFNIVFKRATAISGELFDPNDPSSRVVIFHEICPGTNRNANKPLEYIIGNAQ